MNAITASRTILKLSPGNAHGDIADRRQAKIWRTSPTSNPSPEAQGRKLPSVQRDTGQGSGAFTLRSTNDKVCKDSRPTRKAKE